MRDTFVSARNAQKTEHRIANNFQVTIKNTRNRESKTLEDGGSFFSHNKGGKKLKLV